MDLLKLFRVKKCSHLVTQAIYKDKKLQGYSCNRCKKFMKYRYFRCSNCGRKTRTLIDLPKSCNYCKKKDEDMSGGWIMSEISKSEFYSKD